MVRAEFLQAHANDSVAAGSEAEVMLLVRLLGRAARDPQVGKKPPAPQPQQPVLIKQSSTDDGPPDDEPPRRLTVAQPQDKRTAFKRTLAASFENLLGVGRKVREIQTLRVFAEWM